MLWLIDGYNLMHAAGALDGQEIERAMFQRKRRRFLKTLAEALGPVRCRQTTVVLDATTPPADFPLETVHEGLNLVFALGDENADARIESLIASHSAPRSLTVVSSDRRIRRAARRRRARTLSADEFLDLLDHYQKEPKHKKLPLDHSLPASSDRDRPLSADEAARWEAEFAELDKEPDTEEAFDSGSKLLTDAEIARIQREIDGES
jgi:predicted RNA-binding protein with PIN domain